MKVLQAGEEIAGQMSLTVKGLKYLGIQAVSAAPKHPFGYQDPDFIIPSPRWKDPVATLEVWLDTLSRYDLYHYHFGSSILGSRLLYGDVFFERLRGSCLIVEFWGSEVRRPSIEKKINPYYTYTVPFCTSESRIKFRLRVWRFLTKGHAIVADEAMASYVRDFFPQLHYVRQRVDTSSIKPVFPSRNKRIPLVVHAPSAPLKKGTTALRKAISHLWQQGYQFEYKEMIGRSHWEVLEATKQADIVVDQLVLGSHGIYALESMALGKPVICYISPHIRSFYPPNLPLINATPDTIEQVLREWLTSPEERYRRGKLSRVYVETYHDYRVVAKTLVAVYQEICNDSNTF